MDATEALRAAAAAVAVASSLGLDAERAIVLNDSNRLVLRVLPCDAVARVSPIGWFSAATEVEVVRRLSEIDAPVGALDPRVEPCVVERDGFEISLWTHLGPAESSDLRTVDYADALEHLHRAMRTVAIEAPHFSDRLSEVRRWLVDGDATPELPPQDRALLVDRLEAPTRRHPDRASGEQLLHGEPHPWNVLTTDAGLRFIDFENSARGPVEFDLAWVPDAVSKRYRKVDGDLVDRCRGAVLALVAAHRWRQDDQHPSGRASGVAFLDAVRTGPPWPALDDVSW